MAGEHLPLVIVAKGAANIVPIEPMTLSNMRELGVRSHLPLVDVACTMRVMGWDFSTDFVERVLEHRY